MSILSKNSSTNNMTTTTSFHEFKKQASFFFKEKIKTARLALTDVTPAQLLTEEATNGNPWSPDPKTMSSISKAAFEVDDYYRIVGLLHKRFSKFERTDWRVSYNSLILLEHLLTHGPESIAYEFQSDKIVIEDMGSFQFIDEKGFNWGLAVRKKSDRILKLLEEGSVLKEERDRARKLTRGIQGFGSFSQRSSTQGILQESLRGKYGRCKSDFIDHEYQEKQVLPSNDRVLTPNVGKSMLGNENPNLGFGKKMENLNSWGSFSDGGELKPESLTSFKENMAPHKEESHAGEGNPLLDGRRDELSTEVGMDDDDHPFNDSENHTTASLLSARDAIIQGC
ncbi:ENTH domain-containing protein [Cephalotus follicularis]|uniref:ENTH domain-containing protein n=1 Tax=Cephalotus follicularis TaxID=3775 RepID=A0A1Q3AQU0_CEPFO|nr:ENTH domain-containing protein [Cephalotus follicularis]